MAFGGHPAEHGGLHVGDGRGEGQVEQQPARDGEQVGTDHGAGGGPARVEGFLAQRPAVLERVEHPQGIEHARAEEQRDVLAERADRLDRRHALGVGGDGGRLGQVAEVLGPQDERDQADDGDDGQLQHHGPLGDPAQDADLNHVPDHRDDGRDDDDDLVGGEAGRQVEQRVDEHGQAGVVRGHQREHRHGVDPAQPPAGAPPGQDRGPLVHAARERVLGGELRDDQHHRPDADPHQRPGPELRAAHRAHGEAVEREQAAEHADPGERQCPVGERGERAAQMPGGRNGPLRSRGIECAHPTNRPSANGWSI